MLLELFNNLFMNVAEQTGAVLQNTSMSVNIKERLDFSCAIFDADGNLVANAPHVPVHLGAMGESVRTVLAHRRDTLKPGDVVALNNPFNGGTHLPDVTVITPVFDEDGARHPVLRRQPRPSRGYRRHHPRLDAAGVAHAGRRRRRHRRFPAGRWRPFPGNGVPRAAVRCEVSGAQPRRERGRHRGAGRGEREGRAGTAARRCAVQLARRQRVYAPRHGQCRGVRSPGNRPPRLRPFRLQDGQWPPPGRFGQRRQGNAAAPSWISPAPARRTRAISTRRRR